MRQQPNAKARTTRRRRGCGLEKNGAECVTSTHGARRQQTPTTGDGRPLARIVADGRLSVKLANILDELADAAVALQARARATRRANDVRDALDALQLVYAIWLLYERLARAEVGVGEEGRP